MARPSKQTIDFFPHDCKHTKTMEILEGKFGTVGYALWFKLLEALGSAEGHYLDFSDELVLEHFSVVRNRISAPETTRILDFLSRLNAIDSELWKNRIIWCQHFIDRLSDVYVKRKSSLPVKPHSRGINGVNSPETTSNNKDDGISGPVIPQSKVKESKVKESRERENPPSTPKTSIRKKSTTALPENFNLSDSMIDYAKSKGMSKEIALDEFEGFTLHHRKLDSRFVDWEAAWQTWVRNYFKFGNRFRGPNNGPVIMPDDKTSTTCAKCRDASAVVDGLCKVCYGVTDMPDDFKKTFDKAFKSMPELKEPMNDFTLNDRQNELRNQTHEALEDDDIPY